MGGGGEREGMVDGGGGLRVGKKIAPGFGRTFTSYLVRVGAQVCTLSNKYV